MYFSDSVLPGVITAKLKADPRSAASSLVDHVLERHCNILISYNIIYDGFRRISLLANSSLYLIPASFFSLFSQFSLDRCFIVLLSTPAV